MAMILIRQRIGNIKKIMKKELEESLRHMQNHPTTGLPHNQQVVSTQVETIFIIDNLIKEIQQLNENILNSNKQSERLARTNNQLQVAMLVLSFIGTFVLVSPVLTQLVLFIFNKGYPNGPFILILSYTVAIAVSIIVLKLLRKYIGKNISLKDEIKITDKVHVEVVDSDGAIKEERDV